MEVIIKQIKDDDCEIENVKYFLYNQIKKEYGIGPNMKFHYDIENLGQYYINPSRNTFFIAYCSDRIIATCLWHGTHKAIRFVFSSSRSGLFFNFIM